MLNPICLHQVKHGIKKIKGVLKFADGDMFVMYTTLLQVIGIPLLFFFFLMCVGEGGVNTVEYGEWAD